MKNIPLTQGLFASVSNAGFRKAGHLKWFAHRVQRRTYAGRFFVIHGKRELIHLHRFLTGADPSEWVDHRDGNGLNNRGRNLRKCSPQQNHRAFRRKITGATSKFRGVNWDKARSRWAAYICISGRSVGLGRFNTEIEAARAYNRAAKKAFGSFARFNKV